MPRSLRVPSMPIPTCGRFVPGGKRTGAHHIGFGGTGGTASQVAGTGEHTGRIADVSPIQKIVLENHISKSAIFISKVRKIVRNQLAGMQQNAANRKKRLATSFFRPRRESNL